MLHQTSSSTSGFEPELPPIEHRQAARRRVYFPAKMAHGNGVFSSDCTIRNISETGAALNVSRAMHIPQSFFLIDIRSGVIHHSLTVSVRGTVLGAKFLKTYSAKDPLPAELEYLRRLRTSLVP